MTAAPLTIAYDGKRAVANNTGLGNYSRLAVEVLAQRFPENAYRLYTPRLTPNPRLKLLESLPNVGFRMPRGIAGGPLWRTFAMGSQMAREGASLIHGLSGELPANVSRLGIPSVVTMHDVIFRRCPECYKPVDRKIYDLKFARAARGATRIVAISECTARDVMEFYGVDRSKIDVVYQGCDPQFLTRPDDAETARVRKHYGLVYPYVVSVGTVETRKNQLLALKGLRALGATGHDIHLAVVGRETPYAAELRRYAAENGLGDRLHIISGVPFGHLPALYAGALLSSYTSRYEGFGIPVIESYGVGTVPIVATGSCLEEAGGPATPAVSPDSPEEWAEAASKLISDSTLRNGIALAGREYIRRFSSENMADGLMASYRKALQS